MPFSGGGGGQLTAHVHDNTPLQGGPLNFNNTTIGGMNAGDITFSDGAALQTLTYPAIPAGETLTAAALSTAPSWISGAASPVITQQVVSLPNGTNTTSATLVPMTGSSLVLPNRVGGFAFLSACIMFNNSGVNNNVKLAIDVGGVIPTCATLRCYDAFNEHAISVTAIAPLNGATCQLQYAINSGSTATVINIPTNTSTFQSFECS